MIPVTNDTQMPIYVGAAMIPAGETRLFHEDQVPVHLRPAPTPAAEPEPPKDDVAELAKKSAKDIIDMVPNIDTSNLERLGEMEQARMKDGKPQPRTTVLAAISEEILKRAEAAAAAAKATEGGSQE
jgi:hypothetical protein